MLKRSMQALKAPSATTVCTSSLYFTNIMFPDATTLRRQSIVDSQSSSNLATQPNRAYAIALSSDANPCRTSSENYRNGLAYFEPQPQPHFQIRESN